MAIEELRLQLGLVQRKLLAAVKNVENAVQNKNERLLDVHVSEFKTLVANFEKLHLQLIMKKKSDLSDPEFKDVFDEVEQLTTKVTTISVGLKQDLLTAAVENDKAKLVSAFKTRYEGLYTNMSRLNERALGANPSVLNAEIDYAENEFAKAVGDFKTFFDLENDPQKVAAQYNKLQHAELNMREVFTKNRSAYPIPAPAPSIQPPSSRAPSPESASRRSVLKTKRIDFPTFDGQIRHYNTFKRDFIDIVETPGEFTPAQMSQVLRNECLKDAPKTLVSNVYDYEELWKRLDDTYLDEQRVVEQVTQELVNAKINHEKDYDGFIKYVDRVEQAYLDINAMGNSTVLNNPVTIALILGKCPDWVKVTAAQQLAAEGTPGEEFDQVLQVLTSKRKEARRLQGWMDPSARKGQHQQQQQFQKSHKPVTTGKSLLTIENGSTQVSDQPKKNMKDFKCVTPNCSFNRRHGLSECRAFKRLAPDDKGQIVMSKKLCKLCLAGGHNADNCPRRSVWKPCDIDQCGVWHSRMLHGAKVNGVALATTSVSGNNETLLLVQRISTLTDDTCWTLWDSGSSISLVTFAYAERAGLHGVDCHLDLGGVQDKHESLDTKLYSINLIKSDGSHVKLFAFGVKKITSTVPALNVSNVRAVFPDYSNVLQDRPRCEVDLLVGMQEPALHPVRVATNEKLSVFESEFGDRFLLGGVTVSAGAQDPVRSARTLLLRSTEVKTVDFLTAETLGVDIPRRCRLCISCKECTFKSHQLSWKENVELAAIEAGLSLDAVNKCWTAEYPVEKSPLLLPDNYAQAVSCMRALEKRLGKVGHMDAFNEQFEQAVKRGVYRKLSEQEMSNYSGPAHYVSIVEAYKPGAHVTTPIRLCVNSSLKCQGISLNDILVKGPSALNDIFDVMLGFRRYRVGMLLDVSKFYQSVHSSERDQHLRRVVWRGGDLNRQPDVYITTRVNFGDRPAGCVAQTALRETAKLYSDISPAASSKIINDSYCDDIVTGGESQQEVHELADSMRKIVAQGGFEFKDCVISTQAGATETDLKVLGTCWDTKQDVLKVDVHVNFANKVKGLRSQKDLTLDELTNNSVMITKRIVWRVVLGQFDLLGLISVFTIRLKLIMRALSSEEGNKIGWDEPVPRAVADAFLAVLKEMYELKDVFFPRYVGPEISCHGQRPILVAFGDGSQLAYCALVYICWRKPDGGHSVRFVAGKTRVAPLRKISVPRLELMGAVMATRLLLRVEQVLQFGCERRFFLTDSTAALGMIRGESSSLKEFTGTRVGEIKMKTDVENDWFWLPTAENVADMGTRDRTSPSEMGTDSVYQCGPAWLSQDLSMWPIQKPVGTVPEDEVVVSAAVHVVRVEQFWPDFSRMSSFSRLVRATMFVCGWFWSRRTKKPVGEFFTSQNKHSVQNMIIAGAQVMSDLESDLERYSSLRPKRNVFMDCFGREKTIITIAGRLEGALSVGYDKDCLPLLPAKSPLARLILRSAHESAHSGVDRSAQLARNVAWIVQGKKVAKSIVASCFECKRRNKNLQTQQMAPVSLSRVPPAPPFSSTAVDLFGPMKIRDSVKKRVSKDVWGVIFTCTYTSAVHIEISEDYSTDSFLLCLRRFINLRGMPMRIQSDPGTQLRAAAAHVKGWNFSKILEWARNQCIEWCIIPANSQHYNGCAEAMIKSTKKQLTALMSGQWLTFGELYTLCTEVGQMINSRPLMKNPSSDVLSGGVITPLHLLMGRSSVAVPEVITDGSATPTKRLKFLQQLKEDFWKKWFQQVFDNLAPSYRWKKKTRNVMVNDIVLIKDSSLLSKSFRLGIVSGVRLGKDNCVRSVCVRYKNVDKDSDLKKVSFVEVERSVHSLVVIVPADYKPDEVEAAVVEDLASLDLSVRAGCKEILPLQA